MDDTSALYLGLISGTSVDAVDAVLLSFADERPRLHAVHSHPWPPEWRERILTLAQGEDTADLDALGRLNVAIGQVFVEAAQALLAKAGVAPRAVRAIGSHGQTLRHRPQGAQPFSMQLGDASVIAEHCGIDTVADFRSADVAAGGQGAPLLPALHAMLLARPDGGVRVVLNLGGIANITVLDPRAGVMGFDTGPANGLLDAWCLHQRGEPFDRAGAFAAQGRVDDALLASLLADPYFALGPPKSTGREHFHLAWLETHPRVTHLAAADVQATLLELTARSVADAVLRHAPAACDVLVCGGGVHNPVLMQRLSAQLAPRVLASTADAGIDPDFLEASAFAWLARQWVMGRPGNLPAVTGARGLRILGALHRAPPL